MNTTTTNTVTVSDRFELVVEHTPREQTDDWVDVATVTLTDWDADRANTLRTFRGVFAKAAALDYVAPLELAIRSGLLDGDELMARRAYTYTDKQGETLTGTLEDIGEWLIVNYTPELACIDNMEPWHTLDDFGVTWPRQFTFGEWIEWAATCEDRTRREVERALTEVA